MSLKPAQYRSPPEKQQHFYCTAVVSSLSLIPRLLFTRLCWVTMLPSTSQLSSVGRWTMLRSIQAWALPCCNSLFAAYSAMTSSFLYFSLPREKQIFKFQTRFYLYFPPFALISLRLISIFSLSLLFILLFLSHLPHFLFHFVIFFLGWHSAILPLPKRAYFPKYAYTSTTIVEQCYQSLYRVT
jgi:hypothetical protein